ncbi:hypothetical protein HMPREF1222_02194 [Treponema vincentii F0403]|uniref:Thiol reductant ABC exporter, CydD subunit n=1 Tax=Treponema vincentii F0403 TaxID=1125702 RepID=S3L861_9SPIR|nr:ABC transporter ATP-binding protein/permease [Treponema vincentii]EPF45905.1 hypothetical protein HMPREF1222_02194 [Treponema vincentii F0403]
MIKKRLIILLAHSKRYVYLNVLWQWIALVSQIVTVFFIGWLLEALLNGTVSSKGMLTAAAVFIAALAVRAIATKYATRYAFLAGRDVKTTLRDTLYAKLLKLGASYRDAIATSEVVQLASDGIEQLEVYFGRYLPQFFYSLLAPLTLFAVLAPVSFKAAVILFICVPLIPLSIVAVQKVAKRLLSKYWGAYAGLGDSFLENLQGLTTLKIYQADEVKAEEMDKEAEHFRRITMKVLSMQLNSITVMDVIAYGGAAAGIITAAYQFAAGSISVAAAFSIILLAAEFFIPLRLLGSFFHIAMNGMAASDKLFYVLDLPEPADADGSIAEAAGISVKDLSFSYTEQRAILTDINLTIPHGSFIALAGESGCGKSTIAALLSGKHKNYTGNILFGEAELKTIDERRIMRHITVVKHNAYLFKGTVAANLRIAKPDASIEEMTAALKKVNLSDFLETQKGLDTELQEGGANFSGGQRQRLALARALLFDSPVYIFDEATSNIDIESEERILQVIHELKQTKTVLLISHRLANSVDADCIYFMEHGRITEKGTHSELMALNARYCALYKNQSELERYGSAAAHAAEEEL